MQQIVDRQNEPRFVTLLRASAAEHRQAERLAVVRLAMAVALASAGLVTATRSLDSSLSSLVSGLGATWGLLHVLGLSEWSKRTVKRAAVLQEMFDTELMALPWNAVLAGQPIPAHDVNQAARRFGGNDASLRNYYEISGVPSPYDSLACQQQNLAWGARVHKRYAYWSLGLAVSVAAVGPAVALFRHLEVSDLVLQWYVPASGLLLLAIDNWRAHASVAKDREEALGIANQWVDESVADPAKLAELPSRIRDIQDLLLLTRIRVPRVPSVFFRRLHAQDRLDFQATLRDLTERLDASRP